MRKKYNFTDQEKEDIINDYVSNNLTIREIMSKYDIKSRSYVSNLLGNKSRSISEAVKLSRKHNPRVHSDEAKKKMRESRLKYMKENPEKTAWRQSNMSYPEKLFNELIISNKLNERYHIIREYSFYPYFIDFAFVDIKLAIEIDGSQHILEDRKLKDIKKDNLLSENSWSVLRITAKEVMSNQQHVIDVVKSTIEKLITDNQVTYTKVGIFDYVKSQSKVDRLPCGKTQGQLDYYERQRKVQERPSKNELLDLIKSLPFTHIGKLYGVSDTCIKKWCKSYNLPYRKKDLNQS